MQLDGDIGDCACSIESVDFFNNDKVVPIIDELMLRNYFRYYKVSLYSLFLPIIPLISLLCYITHFHSVVDVALLISPIVNYLGHMILRSAERSKVINKGLFGIAIECLLSDFIFL